ncbi:MAG: carboxypeptidase-like regulatory domain-containing protein [Acidobacteriota bacterium]
MRTLTSLLLTFLAATAAASITGTVLDEEGKPVAGATVRAWAAETSRVYRQRLISTQPENEPLATATTDDAGAFSVDAKGTVAVDLRIEKAGRQPVALETIDGDEPLTVILRPAASRRIRVTAEGKAVAGALVLFGPHLMARTDAAGEAPLLDESAAWVVHPDYAVSRPTASFGTTGSVALQKGVTLRGRVVNAKGAGVKADLFIGGMPVGSSGDDGAFTIPRAPSNWSSLRAVAGKEAAVAARSRAPQIELRLAPARAVSGTVREDGSGRPVAGVRLTLGTSGDSDGYEVALSDAKGNFVFDGVAPRDYTLTARHPAYLIEQQRIATGEPSSRALTARPMARVRGRVIDEQRKAVAGAVVSPQFGGPNARPSAVTDAAGNFSIRVPAAPMPIAMSAIKRGYAAGASPRRKFKDGEVVNDIVITLQRGFPLQVRVVDRKRQPVAGAMVYAGGAEDAGYLPAACEDPFRDNCRLTGADGSVAFRMVEGLYTISVVPHGDAKSIAPKVVGAQQLTARSSPLLVEVDAGVAVSGKVAYADGTLVPDVTIEIRGGMMGNRIEPALDGTFAITGLAPGKLTIAAVTGDGNLSTPSLDVTAPASNVVLTMPRGGRIEGRVVERSTLRPVTDFAVAPNRREQFSPRAPVGRETHSDDGSFVLDNVAPGPTTVRVTARGYIPATRADIQVEEGRAVTGVEVQLERGAKLTGRVTAAGKPAAGVIVRPVATNPSTVASSTTFTDGDGQYTLDGIPPGERTIEFRKQGFITKRQSVETAAGSDSHLDVDLERGRELRGRVTDKSGAGIEGASLSTFSPMSGGDNVQGVTTADGAFVMEGLGETRYNLQIRKSGFASTTERDVVLPQTAPLVITLDRGATITGRVTGLSPNELGSVFVNANAEGSYASAQTDSSGAFTLRGVPEGRVMVSASVMGTERRSRPKTVMVEHGSAPAVEINFEDGFIVRGRVTFNGIATATGNINFSPMAPRGDHSGGFGRVNGGSYEVGGLAAGEYNVNVNSPDGSWRGKYVVSGPGTFDIDVRGATLRGRVVNAESGAPVADANVGVSGKPPNAFGTALSDSEGRFAVPALGDGKYTLSVQRETFALSQQEVTISGGVVPDVEVRLEAGTPTTFVVADAVTGVALTGANVWVDSGGKRVGNGFIRSEEGVRLWLQPGRYTASANAPGYPGGSKTEFTVPGPAVRLLLSRGGTLVVVSKTSQFARLRNAAGYNRLLRLQEGTFGQLPAGEFTLEVLDDKQQQVVKRLPVMIAAGERTTVTVE